MALSYVHVSGDFNPRRVTIARFHGGLHPQGVHEEVLVYYTMASTHEVLALLTVDLHEVSDLLPCKHLASTPQHEVEGSQATPNQSRRHHPPKGNICGRTMNSLLLCF